MMVGLDSSVIIAAVHANHPRHGVAVRWLVDALARDSLVACHHSVLEAYAVLTSLPGDLRVTPSEARDLLETTVRGTMMVTGYDPQGIWPMLSDFIRTPVAGGRSYDAFVARILHAHGARAVATFNGKHFAGLVDGLDVIDPARDAAG
jgi:predicted nucleic acid-binding protein